MAGNQAFNLSPIEEEITEILSKISGPGEGHYHTKTHHTGGGEGEGREKQEEDDDKMKRKRKDALIEARYGHKSSNVSNEMFLKSIREAVYISGKGFVYHSYPLYKSLYQPIEPEAKKIRDDLVRKFASRENYQKTAKQTYFNPVYYFSPCIRIQAGHITRPYSRGRDISEMEMLPPGHPGFEDEGFSGRLDVCEYINMQRKSKDLNLTMPLFVLKNSNVTYNGEKIGNVYQNYKENYIDIESQVVKKRAGRPPTKPKPSAVPVVAENKGNLKVFNQLERQYLPLEEAGNVSSGELPGSEKTMVNVSLAWRESTSSNVTYTYVEFWNYTLDNEHKLVQIPVDYLKERNKITKEVSDIRRHGNYDVYSYYIIDRNGTLQYIYFLLNANMMFFGNRQHRKDYSRFDIPVFNMEAFIRGEALPGLAVDIWSKALPHKVINNFTEEGEQGPVQHNVTMGWPIIISTLLNTYTWDKLSSFEAHASFNWNAPYQYIKMISDELQSRQFMNLLLEAGVCPHFLLTYKVAVANAQNIKTQLGKKTMAQYSVEQANATSVIHGYDIRFKSSNYTSISDFESLYFYTESASTDLQDYLLKEAPKKDWFFSRVMSAVTQMMMGAFAYFLYNNNSWHGQLILTDADEIPDSASHNFFEELTNTNIRLGAMENAKKKILNFFYYTTPKSTDNHVHLHYTLPHHAASASSSSSAAAEKFQIQLDTNFLMVLLGPQIRSAEVQESMKKANGENITNDLYEIALWLKEFVEYYLTIPGMFVPETLTNEMLKESTITLGNEELKTIYVDDIRKRYLYSPDLIEKESIFPDDPRMRYIYSHDNANQESMTWSQYFNIQRDILISRLSSFVNRFLKPDQTPEDWSSSIVDYLKDVSKAFNDFYYTELWNEKGLEYSLHDYLPRVAVAKKSEKRVYDYNLLLNQKNLVLEGRKIFADGTLFRIVHVCDEDISSAYEKKRKIQDIGGKTMRTDDDSQGVDSFIGAPVDDEEEEEEQQGEETEVENLERIRKLRRGATKSRVPVDKYNDENIPNVITYNLTKKIPFRMVEKFRLGTIKEYVNEQNHLSTIYVGVVKYEMIDFTEQRKTGSTIIDGQVENVYDRIRNIKTNIMVGLYNQLTPEEEADGHFRQYIELLERFHNRNGQYNVDVNDLPNIVFNHMDIILASIYRPDLPNQNVTSSVSLPTAEFLMHVKKLFTTKMINNFLASKNGIWFNLCKDVNVTTSLSNQIRPSSEYPTVSYKEEVTRNTHYNLLDVLQRRTGLQRFWYPQQWKSLLVQVVIGLHSYQKFCFMCPIINSLKNWCFLATSSEKNLYQPPEQLNKAIHHIYNPKLLTLHDNKLEDSDLIDFDANNPQWYHEILEEKVKYYLLQLRYLDINVKSTRKPIRGSKSNKETSSSNQFGHPSNLFFLPVQKHKYSDPKNETRTEELKDKAGERKLYEEIRKSQNFINLTLNMKQYELQLEYFVVFWENHHHPLEQPASDCFHYEFTEEIIPDAPEISFINTDKHNQYLVQYIINDIQHDALYTTVKMLYEHIVETGGIDYERGITHEIYDIYEKAFKYVKELHSKQEKLIADGVFSALHPLSAANFFEHMMHKEQYLGSFYDIGQQIESPSENQAVYYLTNIIDDPRRVSPIENDIGRVFIPTLDDSLDLSYDVKRIITLDRYHEISREPPLYTPDNFYRKNLQRSQNHHMARWMPILVNMDASPTYNFLPVLFPFIDYNNSDIRLDAYRKAIVRKMKKLQDLWKDKTNQLVSLVEIFDVTEPVLPAPDSASSTTSNVTVEPLAALPFDDMDAELYQSGPNEGHTPSNDTYETLDSGIVPSENPNDSQGLPPVLDDDNTNPEHNVPNGIEDMDISNDSAQEDEFPRDNPPSAESNTPPPVESDTPPSVDSNTPPSDSQESGTWEDHLLDDDDDLLDISSQKTAEEILFDLQKKFNPSTNNGKPPAKKPRTQVKIGHNLWQTDTFKNWYDIMKTHHNNKNGDADGETVSQLEKLNMRINVIHLVITLKALKKIEKSKETHKNNRKLLLKWLRESENNGSNSPDLNLDRVFEKNDYFVKLFKDDSDKEIKKLIHGLIWNDLPCEYLAMFGQKKQSIENMEVELLRNFRGQKTVPKSDANILMTDSRFHLLPEFITDNRYLPDVLELLNSEFKNTATNSKNQQWLRNFHSGNSSFCHAMVPSTEFSKGISIIQAVERIMKVISDWVLSAFDDRDCFILGHALHTLQDSFSLTHVCRISSTQSTASKGVVISESDGCDSSIYHVFSYLPHSIENDFLVVYEKLKKSIPDDHTCCSLAHLRKMAIFSTKELLEKFQFAILYENRSLLEEYLKSEKGLRKYFVVYDKRQSVSVNAI